jgi:hypothetical protein
MDTETLIIFMWQEYPEHTPLDSGWCVTTDGGDIRLERWVDGKWAEGDRGIIEFAQVTLDT